MRQREAIKVSRLWFVGNLPFALTYSYMQPAMRNVSRAEAEQQPGYLSFEKLGYHIARADLKLRAEKAERPIARALETESHDAILVLQRTTYSGKGEPLEHTTCYLRSDTIEFVLEAHGALQLSATVQQISAGEDVAAKRPVKRGRSGLRA